MKHRFLPGLLSIALTLSLCTLPAAALETEDGYIRVDRSMAASMAGVFAAGDCTGGPLQVAKAVGEGHVAALSACEYLDGDPNT